MTAGVTSTVNSRLLATTQSASNNITYLQVETNTTATNSVRTSASIDGGAASTAVVALPSPVQSTTHGMLVAPTTGGTGAATQSSTLDDFDYTPL